MRNAMIKEAMYQARYALPLWSLWMLTTWWPNNRITLRLRGWLHSPFFKRCGRNFRMANGITFVNPHGIEIGDDVYIAHYAWLNGNGGLVLQDEVVIGPFVTISTVNHC